MNLVRSNGRDLLAMRLKEFEKEDLAAQQKSEIKRHTDNVVVNFINLADNGFKVVQTRLEKMSPEELIAFNELILQKSRRHLWKDTLSRKIAPVCCFVAGLGGIVSYFASFVVLGPGNSTAEFAFGLIFGSPIVAVAGIAVSVQCVEKARRSGKHIAIAYGSSKKRRVKIIFRSKRSLNVSASLHQRKNCST